MKKLLSILAVISLTSTASISVVACSTDESEPTTPGNETTYEEIKTAYTNDINGAIRSVANSQASSEKRTRVLEAGETDSSQYQLFNLDYLSETFKYDETTPANNTINLRTVAGAEDKMVADLSLLFDMNAIKSQLDSALAQGDKSTLYRNIALGTDKTFDGWSLTSAPFTVNIKSYDVTNETTGAVSKEIIYSVNLTAQQSIAYNDEDGNVDHFMSDPISLQIVIGQSGAITTMVQDIAKDLPSAVYNAENSTAFKLSKLRDLDANFKAYGNLAAPINKYLNTDEFKNSLTSEIEKIINTNLQVTINWPDDIVLANSTKATKAIFDEVGLSGVKWWSDLENNGLLNSMLLKDDKTPALDRTTAVNEIKASFMDYQGYLDAYKNRITDTTYGLGAYVSGEALTEISNTAYSFGQFTLDPTFSINVGTYGQIPVSTVTIPWSYEDDVTLTGGNDVTNDEALMGAMYDAFLWLSENYAFQLNDDLQARTKTWFTSSDQIMDQLEISVLRQNYSATPVKYQTWDELKAAIDDESNVNHEVNFLDVNGSPQGAIHLGGPVSTEYLATQKGFQFEGYTSWIQTQKSEDFVIKKTSDGRYGLGLARGVDPSSVYVEYKINLGATRFQSVLPVFDQSYHKNDKKDVTYAGANPLTVTDVYGQNAEGTNLTESDYKTIIQTDPDWLLFEIK